MNPVTARLLSQQLICPQFTKPEEVVSWFGAMQGQEYRMVRWAVAMRTKSPSLKAFEKAFNEGRIVRTHLLRCTWQLVAGEDLGWILSVCRTKALSGLRGWMSANKISIPAEEQELISGIFEETLLRQRSARRLILSPRSPKGESRWTITACPTTSVWRSFPDFFAAATCTR